MTELDKYWRKNLSVMWLTQFVTMMAMNMIVPFLPFFVRELGVKGNSEVAQVSGFVYAGPFLFSIFFTPFWGYLGDKFGRKKMVIRAIIGLGLSQLFIGLSQTTEQLILGRILQGILSGFLPSAMALISTNTPQKKVGYALGLLQAATSAGTVFGPLIGGFFMDTIGIRKIFFLIFIICIINGIIIIAFLKEFVRPNPHKNFSPFRESFSFILNSPILITFLISLILAQTAMSMTQPVISLYIESFDIISTFKGTITGLLFGIQGTFIVFFAPVWGKINEKNPSKNNLLFAASLAAIGYISHYFIYDPYILILNRALLGIGLAGINPVIFVKISNKTPIERRGSILGVGSSFQIIGNLIGPIISGQIAFFMDVRTSFIFSGLLVAVMGLLFLIQKERVT